MSLNATGYVTVPGERLKYRTLPCDIIAAYSLTPAFSFRMKLTIRVIDAHFMKLTMQPTAEGNDS